MASARDTPTTPADVQALVLDRGVRFIRLWFTDILGQLKSFSINAEQLDEVFERGMGFDGSSITGFNAIEESDMIAVPDPSTFAVLPWRPEDGAGVARMFADIRTPEGRPYEGDPRHVLRQAEERAQSMGFDHFFVGPELEYFLFRDNKGTEVLDEGGYFDLTTLDAGSDVRRETVLALEQQGIHVEYSHHEVGPVTARGRHALRRRAEDGRRLHDVPHHRQGVRHEVRLARDVHAQAAVRRERLGMHTHLSLFSDGATPSSTRATRTTCRTSGRRSSPGSCATPASSARSSPSG
jgi:glutamine synthetase